MVRVDGWGGDGEGGGKAHYCLYSSVLKIFCLYINGACIGGWMSA